MHHRKLRAGEVAGTYQVTAPVTEAELLGIAQAFARRRLARGRKITQPTQAFEYLQILLQDVEHEVFSALFLNSQHRVTRFEALFRGTIDSASVYPREVVKQALACNAAAVILIHNHPFKRPKTKRRRPAHHPPSKESVGSDGAPSHRPHRDWERWI